VYVQLGRDSCNRDRLHAPARIKKGTRTISLRGKLGVQTKALHSEKTRIKRRRCGRPCNIAASSEEQNGRAYDTSACTSGKERALKRLRTYLELENTRQ